MPLHLFKSKTTLHFPPTTNKNTKVVMANHQVLFLEQGQEKSGKARAKSSYVYISDESSKPAGQKTQYFQDYELEVLYEPPSKDNSVLDFRGMPTSPHINDESSQPSNPEKSTEDNKEDE